MTMIAITAATLVTPLERIEQPLLLVEDGCLVEVTSRARREVPRGSRVLDFPGGILAPGIHRHPRSRRRRARCDGSCGGCAAAGGALLASHGVSSIFPYYGHRPAGCDAFCIGPAGGRD